MAKKLERYKGLNVVVFGIPRGGVVTASAVAKKLKVPPDAVVVRKLPIPHNPEAGFGAIAPDGVISLNKEYVWELGLSQNEIGQIAQNVLQEVKRRILVYRGQKKMPKIEDKIAIVVDDGLATGYTMISALKYIKTFAPQKLICALPVASSTAVAEVEKYADEFVCPHILPDEPFAVASFYHEFPDLKDEEVIGYLSKNN